MLTLTERERLAYAANDREALALIYAGEEEATATLDEDHAAEIEKLEAEVSAAKDKAQDWEDKHDRLADAFDLLCTYLSTAADESMRMLAPQLTAWLDGPAKPVHFGVALGGVERLFDTFIAQAHEIDIATGEPTAPVVSPVAVLLAERTRQRDAAVAGLHAVVTAKSLTAAVRTTARHAINRAQGA